VYLDHNATTPLDPRVLEAMLPYLRESFGNPSSLHWFGQRARAAVEEARGRVASLIGADPAEIVFTASGSESDNMALRGAVAGTRRRVVTSVGTRCSTARRWGEGVPVALPGEDGRSTETCAEADDSAVAS
jgi:cysteine desulfurase